MLPITALALILRLVASICTVIHNPKAAFARAKALKNEKRTRSTIEVPGRFIVSNNPAIAPFMANSIFSLTVLAIELTLLWNSITGI